MKTKRDMLSLTGLVPEEIQRLIDRGEAFKRHPKLASERAPLRGKVLGLLFEKASTRTRVSFETAMYHLGGHSIFLAREELQLRRGETVEDTARVLSRYLNGLVIRTYGDDLLAQWARASAIPVINGLSDLHHPCQALGDLLTLQEHFGALKGLKLVFVGDCHSNVAHSLLEGAAKTGVHISLACPKGYRPDSAIIQEARRQAEETGGRVEVTEDPEKAVADSDAIYTDVWVSMGREAEAPHRLEVFKSYQVNTGLLALAKPHAVVMHCLPAHREQEIAAEVLDGPQSLVWQQAENRLHIQKAVLEWLLGG